MCEDPWQNTSVMYEIRVSGRLGQEWADWLGDLELSVSRSPGGSVITVLRGPVSDQSALFGILGRIRDLGLKLLSVNRDEPGTDFPSEQNEL
jgi:hypothetical protein